MGKKIEELQVEVDELALSLVGWQVDDVRARLVTQSFDDTHFQEIAVSGTARFLAEDWTDRFSRGEADDYPPTLLLGVSPVDRPEAVSYTHALLETIRKAGKRPVRFSHSSDTWECSKPVRPEQIRFQVTSFDLADTNLDLGWPTGKTKPLPVEVIDETAHDAVRLKPAVCDAAVVGKKRDASVQVRLGGFAEFGSAQDLWSVLAATEPWRDEDDREEAFETPLPGVVVEVLDDTGFLLDKRDSYLGGFVPVAEGGRLPARQPRWVAQYSFGVHDLAGDPARVVVRLLDAEDL
ncbi:hypothetical protein ACWDV7_11115 [Streptomyces sp. NPDC003362]